MKPRILITLGDIAGIGPEIVAKAWPRLSEWCVPTVIGFSEQLPETIPTINPSMVDLVEIELGEVSGNCGQAAYDWLCFAIDECLAGRADGIVTCPLNKEGLHLAGVKYPGHTEILADRCGASTHAMLLYDDELKLAVAHVTLHESVQSALKGINKETIFDKIQLLKQIVPRLMGEIPRIGVMALNPHGGDGGLFGDEELRFILPAIHTSRLDGLHVEGPIPADAMFLPNTRKRYNGIVAMIHDHGHIPMKLLGGRRAVNVTAGLPIVRTSVAHGTAYDIAGMNLADESSLIAAVKVAARLTQQM